MIKAIGLVALGGGMGSAARYLLGLLVSGVYTGGFPWAILLVNVVGCFGMGLASGYGLHKEVLSADIQLFVMTGLCGGFTTFSAFSNDLFRLMDTGHWLPALCYLLATLCLGMMALVWGVYLLK